MLNLKDIAINTREVEIPYPGLDGFVLRLRHLPQTKTRELYKNAQVTKMVSGRPVSELDSDKFNQKFCEEAIVGWSGLTLAHLESIMLIELPDGSDMKEEVPFNLDNAITLLTKSKAFDEFLNGIVFEIDAFRSPK